MSTLTWLLCIHVLLAGVVVVALATGERPKLLMAVAIVMAAVLGCTITMHVMTERLKAESARITAHAERCFTGDADGRR